MDTLKYIVKKYDIDTSKPSPHFLQIGRFGDVPRLFSKLGFKEGAEIGVYKGEYSQKLLKNCKGLKLHMIDAWESYRGYKDFEANDLDDAMEVAKKNVEGYDAVLIKGWSTDKEVLDRFPDESLDFVFIDGNHMYEYVVADIAVWSKKVRKGGIVYGHDYDDYTNSQRRWEEMTVIPAVDGWTKSHRIAPWFVTTNNRNRCWMYVK